VGNSREPPVKHPISLWLSPGVELVALALDTGESGSPPISGNRLTVLDGNASVRSVLASSRHFHQQPQDLEVQPDQGYHQGETSVPLRPFWCSILDALLDELEIKD